MSDDSAAMAFMGGALIGKAGADFYKNLESGKQARANNKNKKTVSSFVNDAVEDVNTYLSQLKVERSTASADRTLEINNIIKKIEDRDTDGQGNPLSGQVYDEVKDINKGLVSEMEQLRASIKELKEKSVGAESPNECMRLEKDVIRTTGVNTQADKDTLNIHNEKYLVEIESRMKLI